MPTYINEKCITCNKIFQLPLKRFNEHLKFNWNFYCSMECQRTYKLKGKILVCANSMCKRKFYRVCADINSIHNFCSRQCSAISNNPGRLRKKPLKKCGNTLCSTLIKQNRKYCSCKCFGIAHSFDRAQCVNKIAKDITKFYIINGRIPYKLELGNLYKIARNTFGTWNKAVIAAGFIPNPVKFAHKFIAKDGHHVDSLSEKIIDDWFSDNKIEHQIHVPYPNQKKFSVDFLVGNTWIEFFGIYGEHKRYTELASEKILLSQKLNLKLIKLFPADLKNLNTTFKSMFRTNGQ